MYDNTDISVRVSVFVGLYTGIEVSCTFQRQLLQNGSFCFTGDVTISGDITLTVLSDLNGPSPQFTLTCISTGGPATTVTWTRDYTTVTEGTETVLDDPVTAQYTHILTVTGYLGGLYTCTVSNNKPSSASASITVTGNTLFSLIQSCNSLIWLAHLYTTSLSLPSPFSCTTFILPFILPPQNSIFLVVAVLATEVGLEKTFYNISESEGVVEICVNASGTNASCPSPLTFQVSLSTASNTAGIHSYI